MRKLQCTKCQAVFWTEIKQMDEALIGSGEWIRSECPKCGGEWAIMEPRGGRKRGARRRIVRRTKRISKGRGKKAESKAIAGKIETSSLTPAQIRNLRKRVGVSQRKLAILAGVSNNAVYLWEKGKSKPSADNQAVLINIQKRGKEDVQRVLTEKAESKAEKKSQRAGSRGDKRPRRMTKNKPKIEKMKGRK